MLWRRAAQHLHSAGRRAAHRGDLAATRNLLERALALAADDAALSAQIAVDLAEGLIEAGDLARADALLTLAEQSPDVAGLALLLRLEWRIWAQPEDVSQTVEAALPGLLERFARTHDERGLAKAHMFAFNVYRQAAQHTPAAEQLLLAADHARNAGDEGFWSRAVGWYVVMLMLGPADAATVAQRLDAIERDGSGPLRRSADHDRPGRARKARRQLRRRAPPRRKCDRAVSSDRNSRLGACLPAAARRRGAIDWKTRERAVWAA
jgi:hypothetical protein